MNKINRIGAILFVFAATLFARGQSSEVVVQATAMGDSYREAVNEALVMAVEQHYGLAVSSQFRSAMASVQAIHTDTDGRVSKLELNDSIGADLKKTASGRVYGFSVLQDSFDSVTKKYRVELDVRLPAKYQAPGLDPANRRRMAVAVFRPVRSNYAWYGQSAGTAEWTMALADKLNVCLTQTRKFTMLDRKFDAEVNDEIARLSDVNAAPEDVGRLARKLGTDYLVVGEVSFNDVAAPATNPFTGQAMPQASRLFAEITYRVILAPTGQLKWTDVVRLDASAFATGDLATFVSATTEAAACSISDGMMGNILPFEIVGRTASGQLVVGEGGKSLKAGEFLSAFALGEEVKDSRTGEVLDVIEDAVGTVQIVRVTDKVSYAQVVEGDAARMVVGTRLRRVPPTAGGAEAPPPQAPATSVKTTTSGGVVVPF